jgi:choline-sulfatase
MKPAHPHILLLMADEHTSRIMGCAGDPLARTPNLDRLAARGVRFTNAYVANPICVPGRYAILTGRYLRDIGNRFYGEGVDPRALTYPAHFARAGYQTSCVGKMHFMGPDQMNGWLFRPYGDMELIGAHGGGVVPGLDEDPLHIPPPRIPGPGIESMIRNAGPGNTGFVLFDDSVTREACIHLRDYFLTETIPVYNPERPLLFQVSWKAPHWPFTAPADLYAYYRSQVGLPTVPRGSEPTHPFKDDERRYTLTDEEILNARAAYLALIEYLDRQIGIVLATLEDLGRLDDFLIVYHSDHGELGGEHGLWNKSHAYEDSCKTPFIISWPGRLPQGRVVDANTSVLDLFPTLCELAGIAIPSGLRGVSLRPYMDKTVADDVAEKRIVFSEYYGGDTHWMMARRGRVKLIRYSNPDYPDQLFDLDEDPHETRNVAGNPRYQGEKAELEAFFSTLPKPWYWKTEGRGGGDDSAARAI